MTSPNHPDYLPPPIAEPSTGPQTAHLEDNTPLRQPAKEDDEGPLQEDLNTSVSHQSPFCPFFTVIQDAHSSEYHHPTVHYVFSDDDTDLITEAALRTLEAGQGNNSLQASGNTHLREAGGNEEARAYARVSSLPPPINGMQEHYIVVDIQPSQYDAVGNRPAESSNVNTRDPANSREGLEHNVATSPPATDAAQPQFPFTLASAHSLSPFWQILNTRLCTARTFDSSTNSPTAASASANNRSSSPVGGLMLEIEGTSVARFNSSTHRYQQDQNHQHRLEEMMEQFEKRMGELRQVIAAGEAYVGDEGQGERLGGTQTQTAIGEGFEK
ncbi:conserved hypothetical protein [Histoplasma capsulatum H143]|uniref:Anaphase promoting complex subunit 11 n=1 Tax=Ajellomyces capsulatus (strain H143) TaxID=544712 RepID=C6HH08_AJECH|nr:conserved hypothetical protein [Histoplasma capsulatum H143]